MKIIGYDEFLMTTSMQGWPPRMNTKLYDGDSYECACGSVHASHHSRIIRELPRMHLVIECPDGAAIVCVKIKGIFSTKLIAEYGAILEGGEAD